MGTVLVTGGGFLAKHLARSLADAGQNVVIAFHRTFKAPEALGDVMGSKVKAERCDVLDLPAIVRIMKSSAVDSVIHTATISDWQGTIYQSMQTNVMGVVNVLEAAAIGSVKKFIYMSAGGVSMSSGENESVSVAAQGTNFLTPTKKCAEILTVFYGEAYGFSPIVVRGTGNFWGPYDEHEHRAQIVMRAIVEGAIAGKVVELPNVGSEEKLYLNYGPDTAAAITTLLLATKTARNVYLIPGVEQTNWGEVAAIVKENIPGAMINFGKSDQPVRGGHPSADARAFPETLAISSEFGFKQQYGVRGGLKQYIDWYRKGRP